MLGTIATLENNKKKLDSIAIDKLKVFANSLHSQPLNAIDEQRMVALTLKHLEELNKVAQASAPKVNPKLKDVSDALSHIDKNLIDRFQNNAANEFVVDAD